MRLSRESAEEALAVFERHRVIILDREDEKLMEEFLTLCLEKLPTEAAYDKAKDKKVEDARKAKRAVLVARPIAVASAPVSVSKPAAVKRKVAVLR